MTCRSPYWYYASTDNPVTLYLMERSNNDVAWLGTNRGWIYQVVYRHIEPHISSTRGGKIIRVSGYGMDVSRNDYVCIFRNAAGYERHSISVKPSHGSWLECTTPTFGSVLTLTDLILQENKENVLWRGSDTWDRVMSFARPVYIGYNKESKNNVGYYFNNVENRNVVLDIFGSNKDTRSLSISASYDSTVYILSKNPNKIVTVDAMTSQVQFISSSLTCTTSACSSGMSISVMECDSYGRLYAIISNQKKIKFVRIDPISGRVTWNKDLTLTGVAHGVSTQISNDMVVVERPSNYLWTISMSNGYARRWYARPNYLIIHSVESIGSNYIAATAFDESTNQERIIYFEYYSSSTTRSTNVGSGVRQGVSTYDQEINKFIHHAKTSSKDVMRMVEFDGVDRRRRLAGDDGYFIVHDVNGTQNDTTVNYKVPEVENIKIEDLKMLSIEEMKKRDDELMQNGKASVTLKDRKLGSVTISSAAIESHEVPTSIKPTFVEYNPGWQYCVHPYYYSCNSCEVIASSFNRASRIWGKSKCDVEYNKGSGAAGGRWGALGCQSWWNSVRSHSPCTTTST